jgi:predicted NUDIX family NTP pyrophosphohydrolase
MASSSAGVLLYRRSEPNGLEVLIAHMGGPFWARKDAGAWSIPKGEYQAGEDPKAAAFREFAEEMGSPPPPGASIELGEVRQRSGKRVTVFAIEADFDATRVESNMFAVEWPTGSGQFGLFPEIDRAEWIPAAEARSKLVKGQVEFVERLLALLADAAPAEAGDEVAEAGSSSW